VLGGAQSADTVACSCQGFDERDGAVIDSTDCWASGVSCKDVKSESDCVVASGMVWAGSQPLTEMHNGKLCADFKSPNGDRPESVDESDVVESNPGVVEAGIPAAEANDMGWPKDKTQNMEIVEEVHNLAPGVFATNAPVDGTFIVVLTEISTACDPGSAGCDPAYEINEKRMNNIETQMKEMQSRMGSESFCGEVVSSMRFLNMMVCNLSPTCTKWMAQLRDIDSIEPDGTVSTAEPDAAVGIGFGFGIGAPSVGISSMSVGIPSEPAVFASSFNSEPSVVAVSASSMKKKANRGPRKLRGFGQRR